jgi:hypothetical protein
MDTLGVVADWCSIVGIPLALIGLVVTYLQLRKGRRETAAVLERRSWGGEVRFINLAENVGVTDVYFEDMRFLPRIGDRITLPETQDGLQYGYYRVIGIHFTAKAAEEGGNAELNIVRVELEPIRR